MARPSKFTPDDILDAAADAAVEHWRDATISHVATRLGAPTGSLYHRFPSREDLFVSLWLRSIEHFHVGFLAAAALPDPREAAIECALHVPRFCREHPASAVAMTLYRQSDLLASAPEALADRVAHVNDEAFAALHDLTLRRYGVADERRRELVTIGCGESPYGLVRRHLRSAIPVPTELDDVVRASTAAILALGDDDG